LNVVRIQIPPLRDRRQDIRLLSTIFLKSSPAKSPKSIAAEALKALEQYHWPGNVRELENVMRRALVVPKARRFSSPICRLR